MRTGEVTAVAPLTSPEEPPVMSCAVVFLPSPVCLSVAWGPSSVAEPRRELAWATPFLGHAGVRWRMRRGPPGLFGPAQQ